jgi:mono/diheme cytochrome c family protein
MKNCLLSFCTIITIVFATIPPPNSSNEAKSGAPTFAKNVAPILYKSCAECHRPSGIAPMSLIEYKEVRPWAKSIRERVVDRTMPPWFADPKHGEFANDPSLTQAEIDTIRAWVDAGSPNGDDKDLPPAPKFIEGWTIGTPDKVLTMREEASIPAEGVVPYRYYRIPTDFTEDKWIQAIEIKPGDRRVVHHVIAMYTSSAASGNGSGAARAGGLGGITPNKTGIVYPQGTARLLRKGSNIILQMHYTTIGEATKDRTSVGLIFAKEAPKRVLGGGQVMNLGFVIPPGAPNHEVKASKTFQEDTYLIAMMPHMHVRGKDFTYTVTYPDGRSEIILHVPKYDFDWQLTYELKKPLLLPKGTKLDCVAHFDNSTRNKFNPDPTSEVRWGDQTWEEMMIGWYTTVRSLKPEVKLVGAASSR